MLQTSNLSSTSTKDYGIGLPGDTGITVNIGMAFGYLHLLEDCRNFFARFQHATENTIEVLYTCQSVGTKFCGADFSTG